jgi:hypothetical protein
MRFIKYYFAAICISACSPVKDNTQVLQRQIDSLESMISNSYKPGFGELMSSVQVHHCKLWFAGEHKNWKLADFEIHELKEAVDNIIKFQTERPESKKLNMISPALDSVNSSIQQENFELFTAGYKHLTATCNDCHRAVNFAFNVVKVPESPPYSNQDFNIQN